MSACPAIVFSNVTAGQFQSLANAFNAKYGIPINGPSGTLSKAGYTMTWTFNAPQAALTVQCVAYPSNSALLSPVLINADILFIAATFGMRGSVSNSAAPGAPVAPRMAAVAIRQMTASLPAAQLPPGACSPVVFSNITIGQFQGLAGSFAARYGIQVDGFTGTKSGKGTTMTWDFNPATSTLTVQCLAHPSFLGCPLINSDIQHVAASLGVTGRPAAS